MTQATFSAGQSGTGFTRARDIPPPAHLGALIAAKPHPRRSLGRVSPLSRSWRRVSLSVVIETATSTYLSALDYDEQAAAKLYRSEGSPGGRRILAANVWGTAWTGRHSLRTSQLRLPGLLSASEEPTLCAAAPSAAFTTDRSRLRRSKDTLFSKGGWQQVTRIEDLCRAQVSHKWLYHLDAVRRKCLDNAQLHYQCSEKTRQQSLGGRWPVPMLRFLPETWQQC